jgi:hypothetical protein
MRTLELGRKSLAIIQFTDQNMYIRQAREVREKFT